MAIKTVFSGYIRRYSGDEVLTQDRFSSTKTVTEYANGRIKLASSHSGTSIMPRGLTKATAVFLETDKKVNITFVGDKNASMDIVANGNLYLNGSFSDVQLKSSGISVGSTNILFDISG